MGDFPQIAVANEAGGNGRVNVVRPYLRDGGPDPGSIPLCADWTHSAACPAGLRLGYAALQDKRLQG
jgi:hypothetical protein